MSALEENRRKGGYAASFLMVTDILKEDTYLWYTGCEDSLLVRAFGKKPENYSVHLPGVMSRKNRLRHFCSKHLRTKTGGAGGCRYIRRPI